MCAAVFPFVLLCVLIPEWLLSWFGPEFRSGATALVILALGQFVNVATGSVATLLAMTHNETAIRNAHFVSVIVNLAAALVLIPTLGILGAAAASAIALALANLLLAVAVRKRLGIRTL